MNAAPGDISAYSLTDIAARLRSGALTSVAVTQAALTRARAAQDRIHCFIEIREAQALEAAAAADAARAQGLPLGPLHGVPLAHKDMFDIAGQPVRYGAKVRGDYRPATTATVIERLAAAGALNIGALNMAEFALGPTGHNAIWGDCRNAIDRDYMAGGSSSGSGAAVGAGVVYAALGSDTGGSVRIPAAANGVVGMKPTYGRVPRSGAMKLAQSIDVIGPLTRSVADCALMMNVLSGHDPRDSASSRLPVPDCTAQLTRGVAGLRIGVPGNYFYDDCSDDVRAAMEASLAALEAQGARRVSIDVPDVAAMSELSRAIVYAEATALHASFLRSRGDLYAPQTRVRASTGVGIPSTTYLEALLLRMPLLERSMRGIFDHCDVLHTPTLPIPVPKLAEVDLGAGEGLWRMLSLLVRCTAPFNYLGLPALALPAARTNNGLRASVQLVGRPFSEALLLRVGAVHEAG